MTDRRRTCPFSLRYGILARQRYRCLYCSLPFGTVLLRRHRQIITAPVYDHRIPYAFLGNNPPLNWRASCAPCNGIKGDLIFVNDLALRRYIQEKRQEKRFYVAWVPPVSSEEDPEGWALAFARWMTPSDGDLSADGSTRIVRKGKRITFEDVA